MMRIMRLNKKGISLIIVVFAIMLFSVLGQTLAVLISGDFESNVRILDSERALNMAEAGLDWGLKQLTLSPSWRLPAGVLHQLNFGQYNVLCRDPLTGETCDAVIISNDAFEVI